MSHHHYRGTREGPARERRRQRRAAARETAAAEITSVEETFSSKGENAIAALKNLDNYSRDSDRAGNGTN